jgi:hypothetical protein
MNSQKSTPTPIPRRVESLDRRMLDWMFSRVLLPFAILILMWPIYKYFLDLPHPFERAFAHGDLLIFSALILFDSASEGQYTHAQGLGMGFARRAAWVLAISFVLIFGFMNYSVILKEELLAKATESSVTALLTYKMRAFSCLNCTIAVVSVLFSAFAYWKNIDLEKTEMFRSLAGTATAGE